MVAWTPWHLHLGAGSGGVESIVARRWKSGAASLSAYQEDSGLQHLFLIWEIRSDNGSSLKRHCGVNMWNTFAEGISKKRNMEKLFVNSKRSHRKEPDAHLLHREVQDLLLCNQRPQYQWTHSSRAVTVSFFSIWTNRSLMSCRPAIAPGLRLK